ncbi:MAG TPA: carboxypeptidase-like regulatory domain-containing protein [Planctomycetota bacterium]|nr:carboxypeptidase-like regulatory domain-containing protein [Planctomycetota bacterium]
MTARTGRIALLFAASAATVVITLVLVRTPRDVERGSDPPTDIPAAAPVHLERAVARDVGAASEPIVASTAAPVARESAAPSLPEPAAEPSIDDLTGVSGRVVDASTGAPIERFKIAAEPGAKSPFPGFSRLLKRTKWRKSKSGTFRITNLSAGPHRLVARADGYVEAEIPGVTVVKGEIAADVLMRLERGATLRGTVVDAITGKPVAGARIDRIVDDPPNGSHAEGAAKTGDDGSFELANVAGAPCRLAASHEFYVERETEDLRPTPGAVLSVPPIALRLGGVIEGKALDGAGEPFAGARVSAMLQRDGAPRARIGRSAYASEQVAADGAFRLTGLASGTWRVDVSVGEVFDDSQETELRGTVAVVEGETAHVALQPPIRGACTVRGRVTRGREPVARARVSVRVHRPIQNPRDSDGLWRYGKTDDEGRFAIQRVFAGDAVLSIEATSLDGSASCSQAIVVPDAPQLEVEVAWPSGAVISGRVTRAGDGTAFAGAKVTARWLGDASAWESGSSAKTDTEGRYTISDVREGEHLVVVETEWSYFERRSEQPTHAKAKRVVDVKRGTATTADFQLHPAASVRVEVHTPEGDPAPSRLVLLHPIDASSGEEPEALERSVARDEFAQTDADGAARFTAVGPGTYDVTVIGHPSVPGATVDAVVVAAGGEIHVDVRLPRTIPIRLRVVGLDGGPGHHLFALDSKRRPIAWGVLATDGTTMLPLPPGTFSIGVDEMKATVIDVEVGDSPPPEVIVPLKRPGEAR